MTRNTRCPLCGGEVSIGHILGSCAHADISHMYTFWHDTAMRSLLKLIQTSSKGNYYALLMLAHRRQWLLWEPVGNDFLSGWSPQQP